MATDEERLVVQLEARIRDFEKNMNKAAKTSGDTWRKVEKDAATSGAKLEKLMAGAGQRMAAGFTAGLGMIGIGGAGIAGVLAGAQQAVSSIADMSAEAKRAGLGVVAFQELSFGAEQARVSVDGLTDGIKEMQLRADEFIVTGAGGGAEAFQRLGYNATELKAKLEDPAALFGEIIERVRELDKASQIRVLDEIFGGTGGEQFVRFLDLGRNSIERLRQEARDAGAVLDAEMVKRAEEVDRKFQALATTVGTRLKGAVLEVVAAIAKIQLPSVEDLAKGAPLDGIVSGYTPRATTFDVGGDQPSAPHVPMPPTRPQGLAGAGDTSNIKRAGETLKRSYADLQAAAQARVRDLQTEQSALGMTTQAAEAFRFKQQALAEAQRMQITLTPQQVAELDTLASQYGEVAAAIEDTASEQRRAIGLQYELGGIASGMFSGLITGTQSWDGALQSVSSRLTDILVSAALLGDGPLGGLFGAPATSTGAGGILGSLFSAIPKFAEGGVARGPAIFGEAGPEAAVPLPDGRRIPVDLRLPAASGATASTPLNVTVAPTINVTGATGSREDNQKLAEQISKELDVTVRGLFMQELANQMRPGGALNNIRMGR